MILNAPDDSGNFLDRGEADASSGQITDAETDRPLLALSLDLAEPEGFEPSIGLYKPITV